MQAVFVSFLYIPKGMYNGFNTLVPKMLDVQKTLTRINGLTLSPH